MPRPGPRPYECVRRAWHSERHQPIRGSLIQQIFRVVNEAHAVATKKNKEWQEKLPVVVLKAEEIMYSKANSEAEYTNLDTLWDRVNDAINTIIRREETTETGDLLPPCVEAALNLGCIPVRASRSQRHSNPRSYLTPRPQDPQPTRVPDIASDERRPPLFPNTQLNFTRTTQNFRPDPNHQAAAANQNHNFTATAMDINASPSQASVYPLYYGTQFRTGDHQSSHRRVLETERPETIYVGTPVIPPSSAAVVGARPQCDLSLRLGTLSNDVGPSTSVELGQSENREFCFFPGMSANEPFEPSSRGKGPLSRSNHEDGKFFCQPGHPSNWFNR